MAPAERRKWLRSPEGIAKLGAKAASSMAKNLDRLEKLLAAETPSGTWFADGWARGVEFPPGGSMTAMIWSRVTGRFTPPQAIELEDYIDGLSEKRAFYSSFSWPASISAVVIRLIADRRGEEVDQWMGQSPQVKKNSKQFTQRNLRPDR